MDDALVQKKVRVEETETIKVLILVLMDDALVPHRNNDKKI